MTLDLCVSSVQEVPAMYPDRVITIKGNIDNMAQAEAAISTKLRECYEKELQAPMVGHSIHVTVKLII